nr:CPBP family intramembrane metalloprotease [Ardenticatenales bacterium]
MVVESQIDQAERGALPALWNARALWGGFALAVLLYVLLSLMVAGVVIVVDLWELDYRLNLGLLLPITQVGMALPPLLIMAHHGNIIRLLGLNRFHWSMLVETAAAILFGFMGTILWALVLLAVSRERAQEPIVPLFGEGAQGLIIALVVVGVLAPLVEEILFRGFLFGGLTRFTGPIQAALISGTLFAAIHLQPLAFPALFVLGVVLALLYHRTGS